MVLLNGFELPPAVPGERGDSERGSGEEVLETPVVRGLRREEEDGKTGAAVSEGTQVRPSISASSCVRNGKLSAYTGQKEGTKSNFIFVLSSKVTCILWS